jgi:FkbM family methyltransferase
MRRPKNAARPWVAVHPRAAADRRSSAVRISQNSITGPQLVYRPIVGTRDSIQGHLARLLRRPRLRHAVRGVRLPPSITQRLPVEAAFFVELAGRDFRYYSSFYDGVGRALYWSAGAAYEPETLEPFLARARYARRVLDIGANTGLFSLAAVGANSSVHVHAFEPVAAVHTALIRNIWANELQDSVTCEASAVGEKDGPVAFHVPTRTWASGSLDANGFHGNAGAVQTTPCTTVDAYCTARGLSDVDLIKIDVEGFEHAVLAGSDQVLATQRPAIICECLPGARTDFIDATLARHDYRAYQLRDDGPRRVDSVVPDPSGRFQNFLFEPRPASRPWPVMKPT